MLKGFSFFWDITQRQVVILYRRFGKSFGAILKDQEIQEYFLSLDDGNDTLPRNVRKGLPLDAV
jgi:hypothetical protein